MCLSLSLSTSKKIVYSPISFVLAPAASYPLLERLYVRELVTDGGKCVLDFSDIKHAKNLREFGVRAAQDCYILFSAFSMGWVVFKKKIIILFSK